MSKARKVLWREGLFLTPQHFQALDGRVEWLSQFNTKCLSQYFWGLYSLDIDLESVSNWQFTVKSVQAIMRDGSVIDCPDIDGLPPARSFEDLLTPDKQSLAVYLALPREDEGRPAVKLAEDGPGERIRYERVIQEVTDYVTGSKPREIEFVMKRPEIRFQGEQSDAFDILPIAQLQLVGSGRPSLAAGFLPPCLALSASPLWMDTVRSMFGRVNALASDLCAKLTYGSDRRLNLTIPDIPDYLQARELATIVPILQQYYEDPLAHPFSVYQTLTALLARLGVVFGFSDPNCADNFMPYDHESPSKGLASLVQNLEEMFNLIRMAPQDSIPTEPMPGREGMWISDLSGIQLTGTEEFYVWARAEMEDDEFMQDFSQKFRVASPEQIDQLITFALPGVPLSKVINPPVMLRAPQKGHYFLIDTRHEMWRKVLDSRKLVLSARQEDFPDLQVRLHVLRS